MKYTYLLLLLAILPVASAQLELDAISTDPAVIAAGDIVDIIVEYSTGDYTQDLRELQVRLVPGDEQTQQYVRILDPTGNSDYTTVRAGTTNRRTFRIQIDEQAPTSTYSFELQGNYQDQESYFYERFSLEVKRQAIMLSVADLQSTPQRLVAGNREAQLHLTIANSGAKSAHTVQLQATLPESIRPSYADAANTYIATVPNQDSAQTTLTVDIDTDIDSGLYEIPLTLTYTDDSQNTYRKTTTTQLYISKKPQLIVEQTVTNTTQAQTAQIALKITNVGTTPAEAIDVRMLKESNQPFTLNTRSGYIGRLAINESETIYLQAEVDRHATPATYDVPLLIRAKGDSNQNDNTIYTYRSSTDISVQENTNNFYALIGVLFVIAFAAVFVWRHYK